MSVRSIHFFLCSLCIHWALFWLFGQDAVEYGIARTEKAVAPARPALTARFVVDDAARPQNPRPTYAGINPRAQPKTEIEARVTDSPAERHRDEASVQNYLPVGRLTLVPVPLTDIDLDIAGINDIAVTGKIELTVLIDAAGTVVDVAIAVVEMENARAFAERVADRFRSSRFIPGEINGKPVRSQLRITVVSEDLFAIDP